MFRQRIAKVERPGPSGGFTLIEILVVIVIVGIMAAVSTANYISLTAKAKYAACIEHQHAVHMGAVLYASENIVGTQVINVLVLSAAKLVTQEAGECPSSGTVDFDDYRVWYTSGSVTQIQCSILPNEHEYMP